jgi:hypothetical protein
MIIHNIIYKFAIAHYGLNEQDLSCMEMHEGLILGFQPL